MQAIDENWAKDEPIIQFEFQQLLNDYLNSNHRKKVEKITKAFNFANDAHRGMRRRSGEPYILHPLAVARVVCKEIGLGSTSICAALLHDVVEDTDYTVEDIEREFDSKIASIVDGLTKISGGIFGDQTQTTKQAENFKRLLLTMSEDIRVIIIKIADRLHNMRTLGSMPPNKQYKIAGETLYIYAPLAYRLGLFAIKTELEDLSFKYEHPALYADIQMRVEATQINRDALFNRFTDPVRKELAHLGIKYKVKARTKTVYSIWTKMQSKNVPFDEIYDILAVRIIFETPDGQTEKNVCRDIYNIVTDCYTPHPERTRDWVASPKSNGYQALHLTVMGPEGQWVEVQIRSKRMDDIAEKGVAAHWKYKEAEEGDPTPILGAKAEKENELDRWIGTIRDILENPEPNALDFLDTIKLNLYEQEFFVFTPKGEIRTMPSGATALDFAYSIHEDLGQHCIGAKVNHRLVPLSHKLQGGDQVEIITSRVQSPQPEWLKFVTTAKARGKIRQYLRREKKTIALVGEKVLSEFLSHGMLKNNNENITHVMNHFNLTDRMELYFLLGDGEIVLDDSVMSMLKSKNESVLAKYFSRLAAQGKAPEVPVEKKQLNINTKLTYLLVDDGFSKNYRVASCCNPIPGDEVLGFIDKEGNVVVHKVKCQQALVLKSGYGDRILTVEWANKNTGTFTAFVELNGIDEVGVLFKVSQIISEESSLKISKVLFEAKDGIFIGKIALIVQNAEDINGLCKKLQVFPFIKTVARIDSF